MHNVAFLQDLAVVMLVAGVVTVVFRWLQQPVVLGYILAGLVIGPHVLSKPLVSSQNSIQTLADLGVVFLLFALGLEFNFRKLRLIGPTAFIVAPLETGLMFFAGFMIGRAFGWSSMDCVYLGGILMISSTTIIAKTLADLGRTREPFAQAIFGILIVEDIIAILLVASLSAVSTSGSLDWAALVGLLLRLSEFIVVAVVLGLLVVPRLLRFVGRFRGDETLLVAVLGLSFGLALLASKLGFSVALGSFIMGALMAESDEIRRIERLIAPLRDMFSAVFFVAIGMLIDPSVLREHASAVAVITAALVGGKVLACSFGSFLAGYDRGTAMRIGLGLGQIGEFSFVIAALGSSLSVTSSFLYPIAVGVSAITTLLTPYLIRNADLLVRWHDRWAPQSLLNYQQDYLAWVRRVRERRTPDPIRRMLRRIILHLAINIALVAAFFLGALFVQRLNLPWFKELPNWTGGPKTVLYFTALILSLPVIIAFLRKLQALSLLLAELAVREGSSPQQQAALRTLLSNTILFAGSVLVSVLLLALSAPLLPTWETLLLLCLLAGAVAFVLRARFIRIYARAQSVIHDTLARPHDPVEPEPKSLPPLPPLLEHADLRTIVLPEGTHASHRTIRSLQLRTRTGASVIAIRRGRDTIHNPGADVSLEARDELLLLGDAVQLQAAERLLTRIAD
ncbi:MAG: cation:proton antiporter [Verrucomicrobia bacterium]|nr:cation:proton antiporter [Verrucomicrobiota bacterium]